MTEQESKVLATKLARIWAPASFEISVGAVYRDNSTEFEFRADLTSNVELNIIFGDTWSYSGENYELACGGQSLLWDDTNDCHAWTWPDHRTQDWEEKEQSFIAQWMPIFRRGCWLSGCAIECTEHEKLEWTLWLQDHQSR